MDIYDFIEDKIKNIIQITDDLKYCKNQDMIKTGIEKIAYYANGIREHTTYLQESDRSTYYEAADYVLYELCKELDVGCKDIRESNDTVDGKAARVAERIREIYMKESNNEY